MSGRFFESYVVSELIKSYDNKGIRLEISHFRNKETEEIDLIIFKNNTLYPLEIKKTANPRKEMMKNFKYLEKAEMKVGTGGIICLYDKLMKLDENDIEWIKSLPDSIKIELDNGEYIYVSHKCTYEKVDNCKYKIFGHSHRQCNFIRDGVKYINPGAVGIPVDGNVGAEFAILEITEGYEKLEEYIVKYNIESLIESLKNTVIYNDEVKWGRLLEKELKTGKDVFFECIEEYNKIREEHKILEENLEVWNLAVKNVLSK